MRYCVETGETQTCLQETEEPGDSIGPSSLVEEIREDEFRAIVFGAGGREDGDGDYDESEDTPYERGFGNEREKRGHKCVDHERDDVVCDVEEELMPALGRVVGMCEGDDTDDELGAEKSTGGDESDPSCDVDPAGNPTENRDIALPGDDCHPMVLSSCCGTPKHRCRSTTR
ncbi:hypothetical protein CJF30_00009561 [Rutstroemia sp. NJR-2017a BBW]|nr:hypothetical protein CJF30_00009561 [Rutstroemia sp. NJR-2017a BBW]